MEVRILRQGQLTTNFTGSVIFCCYANRDPNYILVLFEEGKVKNYYTGLYFSYAGELLPGDLERWLTKEFYSKFPIYGDSDRIVTEEDYHRILGGDATYRLQPDMDCIRKNNQWQKEAYCSAVCLFCFLPSKSIFCKIPGMKNPEELFPLALLRFSKSRFVSAKWLYTIYSWAVFWW